MLFAPTISKTFWRVPYLPGSMALRTEFSGKPGVVDRWKQRLTRDVPAPLRRQAGA